MTDIFQQNVYRMEPGEHTITVFGVAFDYVEKGTHEVVGSGVANVAADRAHVESTMPMSTSFYYSHELEKHVHAVNNRLVSREIRVAVDDWAEPVD
jgi:hypothetical protein